jgi:putative protease
VKRNQPQDTENFKPAIMAPAGNKASFLAAVAAEADAIYCGTKLFSARMQAKNFSPQELKPLVDLAHARGIRVYVTLNTLLKPDDLDTAGKLIRTLTRHVQPDGLIIQDLAVLSLVKQTGFRGEIKLSTLANVSFGQALLLAAKALGVDRVVLPRELNIDEIKTVARLCPPDLGLEVFIHGALCYAVSGRCYWSSYLGGKSGLRGRCVQPCRRMFNQSGDRQRFFSCQDLSLDVLVKVLMSIPQVQTWKIEGRKKGPHYVYYTVQAYRMLRDHVGDSRMKKTALQLLSQALGRSSTHYNFLPQRPQLPVGADGQTGSGLLVAKVKGSREKPFFAPHQELLPGDILRLGYEDEPWHTIERVKRAIPKGGKFYPKSFSRKGPGASPKRSATGTPVFLIDRREEALKEMLAELEAGLPKSAEIPAGDPGFRARLPAKSRRKEKFAELNVFRRFSHAKSTGYFGLWLSADSLAKMPRKRVPAVWWWLPPVVWPDEADDVIELVELACKKGARTFVLNAPWQVTFFKESQKLNLWAGPFCNLANALALNTAKSLGFAGAIVSPELGREGYLQLARQRPFALGIIISGNWPLCVSRTKAQALEINEPFTSPRGEAAWLAQHGSGYWLYPNWKLDLLAHQNELQKAGYSLFVHLNEPLPKKVKLKRRPGLWNWDLSLR